MSYRMRRPARLQPRLRPMRLTLTALLTAAVVVVGCSGDDLSTGDPAGPTEAAATDADPSGATTEGERTDDQVGDLPDRPAPGHVGSITSAEGAALRDSDRRAVIIDVRPLEEYLGGHVVGAQHIELGDEDLWNSRTSALDPTRPVVVYCNTGALAAEAAQRLVDQGFAEVYDLGGMSDWAEGDLPLDR